MIYSWRDQIILDEILVKDLFIKPVRKLVNKSLWFPYKGRRESQKNRQNQRLVSEYNTLMLTKRKKNTDSSYACFEWAIMPPKPNLLPRTRLDSVPATFKKLIFTSISEKRRMANQMFKYTWVIMELTISSKEPASEAMKPFSSFCCPMNKPSFALLLLNSWATVIGLKMFSCCCFICKESACAALEDPKSVSLQKYVWFVELPNMFHPKASGSEWTLLCGMLFDQSSRRLLISKWGEKDGDVDCWWPSRTILGATSRELCCEAKLGKALLLLLIWRFSSGGNGVPWSM